MKGLIMFILLNIQQVQKQKFQIPLIDLSERDTKHEENVVIPGKARATPNPPQMNLRFSHTSTKVCLSFCASATLLKSVNSLIY